MAKGTGRPKGLRKGYVPWTAEEEDRLVELRRQFGSDYVSIADAIGGRHSVLGVRNKVEQLVREGRAPALEHCEPHIQRPAADLALSPDELLARAVEATDRDTARHAVEAQLRVTVDDPRPIAVAFVSDQHLRETGPIYVRRMLEDADLIAKTPGVYAVLGGDGVDNHIKHRAALVGGGSKVAHEWKMYGGYLARFGASKILAMISGNHDDWTRDEAGVDMVAQLAAAARIAYCPDEVQVELILPGQTWRLGVRHQYRFGSAFNKTHSVKRWWEMGESDWDVGVLCHHHEAAMEPFKKHGKWRVAFRPGSYQQTSSYGRRYGFNMSEPTCPTVILWPDRREFVPFLDLGQAVDYLAALRGQRAAA